MMVMLSHSLCCSKNELILIIFVLIVKCMNLNNFIIINPIVIIILYYSSGTLLFMNYFGAFYHMVSSSQIGIRTWSAIVCQCVLHVLNNFIIIDTLSLINFLLAKRTASAHETDSCSMYTCIHACTNNVIPVLIYDNILTLLHNYSTCTKPQ